jgi:ribose-phosphate pyrophosphokinase
MEENSVFVSPDAGAAKKVQKLGTAYQKPVIECSKIRNTMTGAITGVTVPQEANGKACYMVDDICDGGRTFVEIAKEFSNSPTR